MNVSPSHSSALSFEQAQKDRQAEHDLLGILLGAEYVEAMQQASGQSEERVVVALDRRPNA